MSTRFTAFCASAMLVWSAMATGCATPSNPWRFNVPPTAVDPVSAMRNERKTVVVIGPFDDPSKAPNYSRGVGKFMSEAYSRALLNDGKYDVWINPQLTTAVEQIVNRPVAEHAAELAKISAAHPKVHFVVLGKVTDFHHTGDLPSQLSRRGLFGPRNEAIVAIDLRIVDLRTRRVVGAHHLTGTASARGVPSDELYQGIALDSYLFWSTPLGRASKEVVQTAVGRTEALVPPMRLADPQISHVISHRRVSIRGGTHAGLMPGQELFILRPPHGVAAGRWLPVEDVDTGRPLTVRIESVSRREATGWLMGEPPANIGLNGAVLTVDLPGSSQPQDPHPGVPGERPYRDGAFAAAAEEFDDF